MATAWSEWRSEKPKQTVRPEQCLERLIAAEQADRQARRLRDQLHAARFPIHRDWLGIVWIDTPLSKNTLEQ